MKRVVGAPIDGLAKRNSDMRTSTALEGSPAVKEESFEDDAQDCVVDASDMVTHRCSSSEAARPSWHETGDNFLADHHQIAPPGL